MASTLKTCVLCSKPFKLAPNQPGFAHRCPACSTLQPEDSAGIRQATLELERANEQKLRASLSDAERAAVAEIEANGGEPLILELTEAQNQALILLGMGQEGDPLASTIAGLVLRDELQGQANPPAEPVDIPHPTRSKPLVLATRAQR